MNRPNPITVLMYHAIADAAGRCEGADPHYAVTADGFERHLDAIAQAGLRASSVARLLQQPPARVKGVALTFDDGHASNAWAAERLLRRGGTADFFVNPARVGQGMHLGWSDLREMDAAGMSIQSHGQHHRYLDELAPAEVEAELCDSKREIEDRLGRPVILFAPPGGRMPRGFIAAAAHAGYAAVCSSRTGLWQPAQPGGDIPRLAVLASTPPAQLQRWIAQHRGELLLRGARHQLLGAAKRLLGNAGYERLRHGLLGGPGGGGGT